MEVVIFCLIIDKWLLVSVYYRKKDESYESEFKDTINVFLPLRNGAIIDIER